MDGTFVSGDDPFGNGQAKAGSAGFVSDKEIEGRCKVSGVDPNAIISNRDKKFAVCIFRIQTDRGAAQVLQGRDRILCIAQEIQKCLSDLDGIYKERRKVRCDPGGKFNLGIHKRRSEG